MTPETLKVLLAERAKILAILDPEHRFAGLEDAARNRMQVVALVETWDLQRDAVVAAARQVVDHLGLVCTTQGACYGAALCAVCRLRGALAEAEAIA